MSAEVHSAMMIVCTCVCAGFAISDLDGRTDGQEGGGGHCPASSPLAIIRAPKKIYHCQLRATMGEEVGSKKKSNQWRRTTTSRTFHQRSLTLYITRCWSMASTARHAHATQRYRILVRPTPCHSSPENRQYSKSTDEFYLVSPGHDGLISMKHELPGSVSCRSGWTMTRRTLGHTVQAAGARQHW
ncbi:hypothetical protein BKA82DRAFT_468574 [Pisolithus tinctorius]|uniref:Secreted protein n=1 Tax=Pisolithus tinctorius Marx 270 TaxID=870435 RepID=A0A0C3PJ83_PISTI|nr:hypothetical protein BKA82DRAFT_468574 [Pisolithus tinctorius]KIO14205.1 hypothetical protein M404DRAFT_468574 [Pisolithus tinctorius Marx 270]